MRGAFAILLGAAAVFLALTCLLADSHDRRDRAFDAVQRECQTTVVAFDIQGQDRIVYQCGSNGPMRTRSY